MKNKQKFTVTLSAMLVLLVGLSIAYAALSTTLNVTVNSITQSPLSWGVGFTGSSATATVGGTSATGRTCGVASITSTSVTVADTTLSKPGDKCTYALTIRNSSASISATLFDISPTPPNSITCSTQTGGLMVCGNITYKLATNTGGTVLTTGGTLAANSTLPVYLIIEYTGAELTSEAITHSGAKFSIVYNQA